MRIQEAIFFMTNSTDLLQSIYQNAQMGVRTLEHMLSFTEDGPLKKHMEAQLRGYLSLQTEAEHLLRDAGQNPLGLNALEKARTSVMVSLESLTDKSPSHLAEMLLIGSNMGVIDALKNLRKFEGEADKNLCTLMRKALVFEENNAERLKKFI